MVKIEDVEVDIEQDGIGSVVGKAVIYFPERDCEVVLAEGYAMGTLHRRRFRSEPEEEVNLDCWWAVEEENNDFSDEFKNKVLRLLRNKLEKELYELEWFVAEGDY